MSYYHPFWFCFMLCLGPATSPSLFWICWKSLSTPAAQGSAILQTAFSFYSGIWCQKQPCDQTCPSQLPQSSSAESSTKLYFYFIFHTDNGNSAAHGSKMLSRALEETWGCLWTAMSRTKSLCAFEKTWEIRNRSTTISFSHLNPFQRFLNSFVLSLNRKKKKRKNFTVPLPST